MKKLLYVLLILLSFVFICGCDDEKQQDNTGIDLSEVLFNSVEVSWDGSEHNIFVTNLPDGVSVTYEGNGVSEKGVHIVTAKIYDSNGTLLKELTAVINVVEKYDAELPLV